jgi:L-alanine-DL-glutamate epimerase-like enolase superfamily enzyme
MSTYELLAEFPIVIDGYELEGHEVAFSSEFVRKTTVIRLRGAGEEGLGEDVTYAAEDQEALQHAGASGMAALRSLAGAWTLASLAAHLRTLDLFPQPTERPEFRLYRYWAFDSAALDLALRQAGTTLHAALGRECEPLRFVASLRLGEPPSLEPLQRRLEISPGLRFKLDPTPSWDDELIARLVALGAVDSVDLKGQYEGTIVDNPADPALYRRVVEAFGEAWIEDPKLTPETEAVLQAHRARVTWDAPLHSVADIETLPWPPRTINVKPSRFGGLETLLDVYDHCAAHAIGCYGGGQSELGVGRGQIQYLASLFHADAPNDVAPAGFNLPEPPPELPSSPLAPAPSALGFRWD